MEASRSPYVYMTTGDEMMIAIHLMNRAMVRVMMFGHGLTWYIYVNFMILCYHIIFMNHEQYLYLKKNSNKFVVRERLIIYQEKGQNQFIDHNVTLPKSYPAATTVQWAGTDCVNQWDKLTHLL